MRGFEVTQLRLYASRDGARWLGLRTRRKDGTWTITQPVLGPLGVDGLQLVYYGPGGGLTDLPGQVRRIGIVLTGPQTRASAISLETQLVLRN